MDDEKLLWKVNAVTPLLHTPVFDVEARDSEAPNGVSGRYVAVTAPNWVVTVAVDGDDFILVRQYRHGLGSITTEFPGGVKDEGETPEECSARELEEETGYRAGKITVLGTCSPNPALFANRFTVCLAEDLTPTHRQHLDEDEVLSFLRVPIREVIDGFCTGEYMHAFMGTALALYLRHRGLAL